MYRIYLVEDEPNLNQVLATYLRNEGWEIEVFIDGTQALKALRQRPHLWILDIMLPGVDGYQLLRESTCCCILYPIRGMSWNGSRCCRLCVGMTFSGRTGLWMMWYVDYAKKCPSSAWKQSTDTDTDWWLDHEKYAACPQNMGCIRCPQSLLVFADRFIADMDAQRLFLRSKSMIFC